MCLLNRGRNGYMGLSKQIELALTFCIRNCSKAKVLMTQRSEVALLFSEIFFAMHKQRV